MQNITITRKISNYTITVNGQVFGKARGNAAVVPVLERLVNETSIAIVRQGEEVALHFVDCGSALEETWRERMDLAVADLRSQDEAHEFEQEQEEEVREQEIEAEDQAEQEVAADDEWHPGSTVAVAPAPVAPESPAAVALDTLPIGTVARVLSDVEGEGGVTEHERTLRHMGPARGGRVRVAWLHEDGVEVIDRRGVSGDLLVVVTQPAPSARAESPSLETESAGTTEPVRRGGPRGPRTGGTREKVAEWLRSVCPAEGEITIAVAEFPEFIPASGKVHAAYWGANTCGKAAADAGVKAHLRNDGLHVSKIAA